MINTSAVHVLAILNNDGPDQGQKEQSETCAVSDVWIHAFGWGCMNK